MVSDSDGPVPASLNELEAPVWGLWDVDPGDLILEVGSPPRRVRVEEAGSGPPVLLVHGGGGYGPYWAPLVSELGGYRCLMLDRPGWGGSDPADYSQTVYREFAADLMVDVLDVLGVGQVHSVGASIGGVWALALASKHPDRVLSVTLLGAGPLSDDVDVHMGLKVLTSPLGSVMSGVRWRERMERGQVRQSGHGPALDDGRIPRPYLDWKVEMTNRTGWRIHERAMMRAVVGRGGWKPGLTFDAVDLSSLSVPVLLVCGTSDPGFEGTDWERFIDQVPEGTLDVLDGAGHMPWFDDPAQVGNAMTRHFQQAVDQDQERHR